MKKEKKEELQEALDNIEKGQPRKKFGGCLKALIIFLIILGIIALVGYFLFFSSWALPGTGLKGESSGQINILVMGRGGEGHSGANLTDTIMLLMIRNKEKRVGMLSIPRDLWVETEGYGGSKINAVYSQAKNAGESDKEAIGLVKDQVKDITGIKPNYYALIDFEGLSEIVDTLGGVDVNVDTAFTDTLHSIDYPQGKNHFDGEEAVMYTRARYATSGEGSDFQRADRQQDLILAIKDEALTSSTLFSPSKLSDLSKQYKRHIITDISV
ncbi:LCP family protein, partial [Patescibacteria group bacterium]